MEKSSEVNDLRPAEMMAIVLSRYFKGELLAGVGAYSQIPLAAIQIARQTYNPNLWWFSGGSLSINPRFEELADSAADFKNTLSPEHVARMEDLVAYELGLWRKRTTVGALGGMQIDKYGNSNMVCIGDYERPKVRGPGTVGLVFTAHFSKIYYYVHHHSPKIFVEKADFISGPGFSKTRARNVRPHCEGPSLVLTPIAVMGFDFFDEPIKTMYLRSVHPGHTVDEVVAKTGFKLNVPREGVGKTDPPTGEEILALQKVDPKGVLKRVRCG
jgi:glutaconate CoA-transferase subunit B